ncbi:MAG TPA: NAD(P)H-hydrate dehydratase [Pseudomonadales bacterium]|nr:NAD(P)H-hydrate dehydratase [Pseudomonadales bacterium]
MKNALDDKLPVALYTAAGVRELDRIAIEERGIAGITLMRRAAAACVAALQRHWPAARRVTVFCGSGNNAGDGYIVAGMLAEKGCDVTVMVVGDPHKLGSDAAEAHRYCLASEARVQPWEVGASIDGDVIVDALLGTGLTGQVRERYLAAVDDIAASARPVLAVDIPSGLSADTGMRLGGAVVADVTVTFIGLKRGLFTLGGPDCAGLVEFAPLDVPSDIYDRVAADSWRLQLPALLAEFPSRPKQAHKNLFGHVLVVGGDEGMGGAALMSAESALRVGAGLVSVATHPVHVGAILSRRPELMVRGITSAPDLAPLLERVSVVVLGPGLGRSQWSSEVFARVMQQIDVERQSMILDADGLNLLSEHPQRRDNWVLTPHPGEAANLLQDRHIQEDRFAAVDQLQEKFGGTVLLKGAGTVIADGHARYLCPYGNPGMSTAGMGDVLSGVIGGLVAQGLSLSLATRLGVCAHAAAGDDCAEAQGERGLIATDLIPAIRKRVNR